MFRPRSSFKNIIPGLKDVFSISKRQVSNGLKLDKVLVVSKMSRYEYERRKHDDLCEAKLEEELIDRGSNFERLLHYHNLHKNFEKKVVQSFKDNGIEVEVVNQSDCTKEKINWADIVVPVGGDGTFLLAASKVNNNTKPVIGFNSDPTRSEGHLCLPKKYSMDINAAIHRLQKGEFDWLLRSRIRTVVSCKKGMVCPTYLNEIDLKSPTTVPLTVATTDLKEQVLPVLALNEVFVGEALSARVSHLQVQLNGSSDQTSIKCSGVCVCTGTGSTSWHLSINRLPSNIVEELLKLVDENLAKNSITVENITETYNKNLIFDPASQDMFYTIRENVSAGVWPKPKGIKPRSIVKQMTIKSFCFDAKLVIDGGMAFPFNDGTIARLEVRPEDALRTVIMSDENTV